MPLCRAGDIIADQAVQRRHPVHINLNDRQAEGNEAGEVADILYLTYLLRRKDGAAKQSLLLAVFTSPGADSATGPPLSPLLGVLCSRIPCVSPLMDGWSVLTAIITHNGCGKNRGKN